MVLVLRDRGETIGFGVAVIALVAATIVAVVMPSPFADPTRIARIELPEPFVVRLPEAQPATSESDRFATNARNTGSSESELSDSAPSGAQARIALPKVDENGLIPLQFDLSTPGNGSERIESDAVVVSKTLVFGDRELGSAQIHIDSASRLLIDPGELGTLLASSGIDSPAALAGSNSGLRTFAELRRMGVDLRYDPARDRISLSVS